MSNKLTFQSDKVKVTGPKVDGGYSVTFEVGEYEQLKIAALMTLPQDQTKTVEVSCGIS